METLIEVKHCTVGAVLINPEFVVILFVIMESKKQINGSDLADMVRFSHIHFI